MDHLKLIRPQIRFFPYFGSKYTLSRLYPHPKHRVIVEPFAGSAGYATRYGRSGVKVILNDLDPKIVGIWSFLIRAKAKDILKLPLLSPGQSVSDLSCCEEARWLIGMWIGHSHVPRLNPSGWFNSNPDSRMYWGSYVRRKLAEQAHCCDEWEIHQGSYEDVPFLGKATWLIDPPYQEAGKLYTKSQMDFPRLATWCKSRQGQVIVCENMGADWLDFHPIKRVLGAFLDARRRKQKDAGHRKKVEAVWLNHPEDYRVFPKGLDVEIPDEGQSRGVVVRAFRRIRGRKQQGGA